jgi:putative SOS response-associated peptidase YedK
MCYHTELTHDLKTFETRFQAKALMPELFDTGSFSAFTHPVLPVITDEHPLVIQPYQWGLIPSWAKDAKAAKSISEKTFNAAGETIFEKPSFKASAKYKRCLILVDGFKEWKQEGKRKIPYRIGMKDGQPFPLAGLWSLWTDPFQGQQHYTFSIVTTAANTLMAEIHNTKLRMPLILGVGGAKNWLNTKMSEDQIKQIIRPCPDAWLNAVREDAAGEQLHLF